ncbi:glycosyltransferase family 39 protein [Cohnella nanjingensis]|uniref:Glycosyltransferase family 39 protein n=1 Tax=Cohnella nanjingensis TaxID=1387779 RepID=A0A7X0VH48_9BACL|nr:glycosyltransferase family 39 protein [Cohnella nanjingensis]MBB6673541.1 glycosyltransferase family 39 protein [Cohnella nanjingensis]
MLRKSLTLTSRAILAAGGILFAIALAASLANGSALFGSPLKIGAAALSSAGLILFMGALANRYLSRSGFLAVLLALGLGLRLAWIFWIDTPPASDFAFMHAAAMNAASGDYSFGDDEYFRSWVYQLGFTMYEALVIKLFGSSLIVLKLLNALFGAGTSVLVYGIGRRLFNEFSGRTAALLHACYIPHILMCSVLTNQHLSIFLFTLGCWLVLNRGLDAKFRWIGIGLAFGLGNVMRPLGSIFLIGFAAYVILFELLPTLRTAKRIVIAKAAGVLGVFYLVQMLVSYALIAGGVTEYKLSNREPYWKFMVGLNAATDGGWSMEDAKLAARYPLGEARNEAELAVVKMRLSDKAEVAALMARKLVLLWGGADSATMWSLGEMGKPELTRLLDQWERTMYVAMSAFGACSLFVLLRRGETRGPLFLVLLWLGYAAVHLAIEVQTRYRLDFMPVFILLQSYGAYALYERVRPFFSLEEQARPGRGVPM